MEVNVVVGGVKATVTVSNADEAVEFLSKFAALDKLERSANKAEEKREERLVEDSTETQTVTEQAMIDALQPLSGSAAAQALLALSNASNGWMVDTELRTALGLPEGGNLGPVMSAISKGLSRGNVAKDDVLKRQTRRGPRGKTFYRFGLTDKAKQIVAQIEGFGDKPDFALFDSE